MRAGKTLTSAVILTMILVASAFLFPLDYYIPKSRGLMSNVLIDVNPPWDHVTAPILQVQVRVGTGEPLSPNGNHFRVENTFPLQPSVILNGTVTVRGAVKLLTGTGYTFYVFNTTSLTNWESGQAATPYFFMTGFTNTTFQFSLTGSQAVSQLFFAIEASDNQPLVVSVEALADYVARSIFARTASRPTNVSDVKDGSRDIMIAGNVTLDGGTSNLYSFYLFDYEGIKAVYQGLAPSTVPSLFSAMNASKGVSFSIPISIPKPQRDLQWFFFAVNSPLGNPVRVSLTAQLKYEEKAETTPGQYVLDRAANSLLSDNPVSQAIGSFAGSIYPYVYLLGSIIIFVLFLAVVQLFVLVGLGSVSESRVLRRLDAFRDRFDHWKRQLSRLGKSEESS